MRILFDGRELFVLWQGNADSSPDHCLADDSGRVLCFRDPETARRHTPTGSKGKVYSLDLDCVAEWVDDVLLDLPASILDVWNFLEDFCRGCADKEPDERGGSTHAEVHGILSQMALQEYLGPPEQELTPEGLDWLRRRVRACLCFVRECISRS